eukprot:131778_1
MTAQTIYFGSLFYGDMTPHISILVNHFHRAQQHALLHQIIDIGLGSIFPQLSCSTQSQIIESLPHRIKHSLVANQTHFQSTKSLQFVQMRRKLYLLHQREFIQFLCTLCTLLLEHNLFAKLLQYGFEHYRHQNTATLAILNSITHDLCTNRWHISPQCVTNDQNLEQTLCVGFCGNHDIPSDITHLCYYYYFLLYDAQTQYDLTKRFGHKFIAKTSAFSVVSNTEMIANTNTSDAWETSITNRANTINAVCNVVKRNKPHKKPKHEWFNAFGTRIISFGQSMTWNVRITPCIGNMLIGMVKCMEMDGCRKDNQYILYNKREDFAFDGFGFMPASGMAYHGKKAKRITQKTYDYMPQSGVFNVRMRMDMTRFKCVLRFWIDNDDIGIVFDEEIDPTKKYRMAVAMHETQAIEIV